MPAHRSRSLPVAALALLLVIVLAVPALAQTGGHAGRDNRAFRSIPWMLARMSLEEKVGQLFWTRAYGSSAHDTSLAANNQADYGVDTPAQVVEKYHLGGVLYFAWAGNTDNPRQIAELSNGLQEVALGEDSRVPRPRIPLALTIDQEGGLVQRMLEPATVFPGNMPLGATWNEDLAAQQWDAIGEELAAIGVNMNFAPVVDVNTNPANPVINVRSFGEDPEMVGRFGTIATAAQQARGVGATLKHFPGYGDTETDSHYGLPLVTYDRDTLEDVHVKPFRDALAAEPDAIMTAHIIVEAIDPDMPATLSHDVLTGLLREELGYDGLIITDSLDMAGALEKFPPEVQPRVPLMAFQAGADVLLNPPNFDEVYTIVLDAARSGEISRRRLDESVARILRFKLERGLFDDPFVDVDEIEDHVGTPEHLAVADAIAEQAATVVRDDADLLPLDAAGLGDTLVVGPSVGQPGVVASELSARGVSTTLRETGTTPTQAQIDGAVAAAQDADLVVVTTYNGWRTAAQQTLVDALIDTGTPVIVVATRDAYDLMAMPDVETYVATYGNRPVSLRGAVRVLLGEVEARGRLPVRIPAPDGGVLYPIGHGLTP
ncbi:MAG TPA: glycoside hydrolase family 3 N-terminal domain-containing protein [Egibacteraceae bacterium]